MSVLGISRGDLASGETRKKKVIGIEMMKKEGGRNRSLKIQFDPLAKRLKARFVITWVEEKGWEKGKYVGRER